MRSSQCRRGSGVGLGALIASAGILALSPLTAALAAEAGGAASGATLEEVVVTAERREENLQKVPIAVNIVSGEDAIARGAVNIQTLSTTVPNLMNIGTFTSHTYVRGVGSFNTSNNNESAVATYVDGVYMPSASSLFSLFNKIQRIEVLKGPQGTLFGRNTTGGVIQIVTLDPKREFGGSFSAGYGNYDTSHAEGYITGGISQNVVADLAVIYENQATGWGKNLTTGLDLYKHGNIAMHSKWIYTPSEATKVTTAIDASRYAATSGLEMWPGSVAPGDHVTTYAGRFNSYGENSERYDRQYGAMVRVDHESEKLHFTSISSYRRVTGVYNNDNDRTPLLLNYFNTFYNGNYGTEELQLSNRNPGRLTWLVGIFAYGNQVATADPRIQKGSQVTPGGYQEIYSNQITRSYSVYAQGTLEVVSGTNLTLGARYTDEKLDFNGRYQNAAGALIRNSPFPSQTKYKPTTWRVALDHQFTPDVMGYISANHGFKAGGYNGTSPDLAPFKPETLNAYEIGLKSEFMNHRMRLNVAGYYYDYKDIQVVIVPGGAGQIFTNAGAARNYGIDAGLDFAATDRLTLSAGLGLLDAKYTEYLNAQGFTSAGVAIPIPNAAGRSLTYSPPHSEYVSADYRVPTGRGEFKISGNLSYKDRYFVSPAEIPVLPGYYLLAASVDWTSNAPKPFGFRIWGRNLTNEYVPNGVSASSGGWYGGFNEPATYGVTFTKKF